MSSDPRLAPWVEDARAALAKTWIRRLPPVVLIKRGPGSPVWLPWLWFAGPGMHVFLWVVAVSEDLLETCPAEHRRAILAHEVGHLQGLHGLIWLTFGGLIFGGDWMRWLFQPMIDQFGVAGALGSFFGFGAACVALATYLLHRFEYWADDYAVDQVGAPAFMAAVRWMRARLYGDKVIPWIEKRLARIQARTGSAS